MRLTTFKAFEKQLSSATPGSIRLFLIQAADDFERKQAMDAALASIASIGAFVERMSGLAASASKIIDAMNSPALFGSDSVIVVDEADKKLVDDLALHFKRPPVYGYLFLGVKSKVTSSWVDEHGMILDLLEERPWEKEKRCQEMIHAMAQEAGKRLSSDAAMWMIERMERDAAVLTTEMQKLICYTAAKSTIDLSDVEAICSASRTHTLWQIADDLVWGKVFRANIGDWRDQQFFHSLLAQLRQQFLIGIKMHDLIDQNVPTLECGKHFPKIFPKTLEKKAHLAQRMGVSYFREGLNRLFEIELLAKNSAAPVDVLIDYFRIHIA